MVNQALFDKYFDQIEDSFTRTITKKNREGWYREVYQCSPELFALTMRKMKRGDRFPTFGSYWVEYNIIKNQNSEHGADERGCADCRKGFIHYVKGGYDITAFCKVCWPEKRIAQDPRIPRQYQLGMEPWRSKPEVMIPPTIAKAMIQELSDKMKKPGIDWQKEVDEAWKFHENMKPATH